MYLRTIMLCVSDMVSLRLKRIAKETNARILFSDTVSQLMFSWVGPGWHGLGNFVLQKLRAQHDNFKRKILILLQKKKGSFFLNNCYPATDKERLLSPLSLSSLSDESRQLVIAQRYLPFPFPVLVIYVSSKSTHQLYPGDTAELLTDLLVSPFFRYLYSTEQRPDICTIQCMTPTIFRPHKFSQLQEEH